MPSLIHLESFMRIIRFINIHSSLSHYWPEPLEPMAECLVEALVDDKIIFFEMSGLINGIFYGVRPSDIVIFHTVGMFSDILPKKDWRPMAIIEFNAANFDERFQATVEAARKNLIQVSALKIRGLKSKVQRLENRLPLWYVSAQGEEGEDYDLIVRAEHRKDVEILWAEHFSAHPLPCINFAGKIPVQDNIDDDEPEVVSWFSIRSNT